jgi:hypothetical protein
MKVGTSKVVSQGRFLVESPANPGRGVETTQYLNLAKRDFADQTAVDTYVVARGGAAGDYLVVDLGSVT